MYYLNKILFQLTQRYPIIAKIWHSHDGLIEEEIQDEDYVMGDQRLGAKQILKDDGQYDLFLPEEEIQRGKRMESMNCTRFALLNDIETIAKTQYGKIWNRSDRFNSVGVRRGGATMSSALSSVRKFYGTVDEKMWPVNWDTFTWEEYYKQIPVNIRAMGQAWIKEYEVGFERVPRNINLMKQALKYSPLYVSGFAWSFSRGLYRSYARPNHCFVIYGYEEGKCWKAFDSYSPYKKQLDWNFYFGTAYIITLKKKSLEYNQREINKLIARGFKFIQRTDIAGGGKGQVYRLTDSGLQELSQQEKVEIGFKSLADRKDMTGVWEKLYYNLIK